PQFGEQGQSVHDRHVDVEQQQRDIGLLRQYRERLLAVMGETEGEFLVANLAAEALPDQHLEIGFVVDRKDLRSGHQLLFTMRQRGSEKSLTGAKRLKPRGTTASSALNSVRLLTASPSRCAIQSAAAGGNRCSCV